jgi:hypothetical protein
MDEIELAQIEQLLARVVDEKLGVVSAGIDKKLETVAVSIDQKLNRFKEAIIHEFSHQIKLQTEDFQQGLSVVAEGHQMLSGKLDRVESGLDDKLESISAKLSSHRVDTEAHGGIYLVKES